MAGTHKAQYLKIDKNKHSAYVRPCEAKLNQTDILQKKSEVIFLTNQKRMQTLS